jgi:hypothetical protein
MRWKMRESRLARPRQEAAGRETTGGIGAYTATTPLSQA